MNSPLFFVGTLDLTIAIVGGVVGIITGIIVPLISEANARNHAKKYARPEGFFQLRALRRRARAALLHHKLRMAWPYLIVMIPVNPFILASAAGPDGGFQLTFFYLAGYALSIMATYPLFARAKMRRFREVIAVEVAQQLAFKEDPTESSKILLKAARQRDSCHRLAAVIGLRELGTVEAQEMLALLREDKDEKVAKFALDAYVDLKRDLDLTSRPFPELPAYVLRKVRPDSESSQERVREWNRTKAFELLDEKELRRLLNAQLPLRRGAPHLYCMECYAAGAYLRAGEWDWAECRICGKSGTLETGVERVVGQIGGDYEWLLEDGTLYVNLWDQDHKKARAADIDVLEIVEGADIDYDWAISAVLEQLAQRENAPGKQWFIRAADELPALQKNTLQLLRTADAGLRLEE
jgi:hypothetical protein